MRAIILGGGGSKGSYQIGVWRALLELGIDFDLVIGVSTGALNGYFMATKNFKRAKEIWDHLSKEDIIAGSVNPRYDLDDLFSNIERIIPFLKSYLSHGGLNITPFKKLLEREVQPLNLTIPLSIITTELPFMSPIEVTLNSLKKDSIVKYLIASASCFPAFPICKIGSKFYIDGGYSDNLPIAFALQKNITDIIAIDLNADITHPKYLNDSRIKYLVPSLPLGSFLHFDKDIMRNNQQLGYLDTMKYFHHRKGYQYTFTLDNSDLQPMEEQYTKIIRHIQDKHDLYHDLDQFSNSHDLFLKGLEKTMSNFGFSPYQEYNEQEMINYFRHLNILTYHNHELRLFKNIKDLRHIPKYFHTSNKLLLLKYIYYLLQEKTYHNNVFYDISTHYEEELFIVLWLYVIDKDFLAKRKR